MKRRISPICARVEMNANAVWLTDDVRPSSTAVSAAARTRARAAARGVRGGCQRRTIKIGQRRQELIRHEQAHVLVQHRPAHLERCHEVVIHEKRLLRHGGVEFAWRRRTPRRLAKAQ
jgi:hypothetical protein